jgi:hypothetical protein
MPPGLGTPFLELNTAKKHLLMGEKNTSPGRVNRSFPLDPLLGRIASSDKGCKLKISY